jgi:hypothetical protein
MYGYSSSLTEEVVPGFCPSNSFQTYWPWQHTIVLWESRVLNSLQVVGGAKRVGHRIEQEAILPHKLVSLLFILDWHPLIM